MTWTEAKKSADKMNVAIVAKEDSKFMERRGIGV